jgi:hypothetical protein
MVDYRRLICPHPPSPIHLHGCNTNGRSLPHAPPTGCLTATNTTIPWPPLVVPFATKNGINKPFAKTNRPLGYCLRTHQGGPFYKGLALARTVPTGIGSGLLIPCGRTSTIASRQRPANAISTSKLLTKNRRLLTANASSMSVPPTNARRLPAGRLHIVNAFLTRRPLVTLWPNALLLHARWQQPKPYSYGFAAAASTSNLPSRLHGDNNTKSLLHVCDTSRTAACLRCSRRSSIDRQLRREQRLWPIRLTSGASRTHWPMSNVATRPTSGAYRMRWLMSNIAMMRPHAMQRRWNWHLPRSNVAESQRNVLRQWQRQCWPRNDNVESQWSTLQCRQGGPSPTSIIARRRQNALRHWRNWHTLRSNIP